MGMEALLGVLLVGQSTLESLLKKQSDPEWVSPSVGAVGSISNNFSVRNFCMTVPKFGRKGLRKWDGKNLENIITLVWRFLTLVMFTKPLFLGCWKNQKPDRGRE